jgi:hypothetical protein
VQTGPDEVEAERSSVVGMDLRGTLDFTQFLDVGRSLDVGPGYSFMLTREDDLAGEEIASRIIHGPTLNGTVFVLNQSVGTSQMRVGVNLGGELLFDSEIAGDLGYGGRVETFIELAQPVRGEPLEGVSSSGGVWGVGYGETSFGAYLAGGYQELPGRDHYYVVAGLTFRVPASAGIVLAVP